MHLYYTANSITVSGGIGIRTYLFQINGGNIIIRDHRLSLALRFSRHKTISASELRTLHRNHHASTQSSRVRPFGACIFILCSCITCPVVPRTILYVPASASAITNRPLPIGSKLALTPLRCVPNFQSPSTVSLSFDFCARGENNSNNECICGSIILVYDQPLHSQLHMLLLSSISQEENRPHEYIEIHSRHSCTHTRYSPSHLMSQSGACGMNPLCNLFQSMFRGANFNIISFSNSFLTYA